MNTIKTNHRGLLFVLKNISILLFVVIFVGFSLFSQRFSSIRNFENIILSATDVGIIAIGMTFVLLTGGIDLSVGAIMYITGAVLAIMLENGVSMAIGIPCAILSGTLWGCLNAFLISKVKIIPFMVTLGTLTAGRGLGLLITHSRHISVPDEMRFGATRIFNLIPIPIIIFALMVLLAVIILQYTSFGRQIYAMGNDPEAAKKAGLNTARLTALVYILSGFCAAIASIISISQVGSVSSSFGEGTEFQAIAASVMGGTSLFGGVGNVFPGTVVGILLIQMIQNGLIFLRVDLYLQEMVKALIILFAVFIDAQRTSLIRSLERRHIRVEKSPALARGREEVDIPA
ncbi:ABC transporter permease [Bellilinea sp.]|uniref:ABC transporter permease n=1 Tax=Bellilinea sp. TaxID=2838785 RepID=UPI002ADDF507|nr:ABC transporter permease [Bellilinea sp.]